MTLKAAAIGLFVCAMIACLLALVLLIYLRYLIGRCEHLSTQNDFKSELIHHLNEQLEQARLDYRELTFNYYELRAEIKKKEVRKNE